MTVQTRRRLKIFYKTIILLVIAAVLGALCYYASANSKMPDYVNSHVLYSLASAGISLATVVFIAWKIRYFHDIFAKEIKGTVVSIKREIIRTHRALMSMDEVVIVVQLDGKKRKKKLRLPGNKVGNNVYFVGDKIYRIKGTRFPINLTREEEQHICPICGRDSCYDDECPDCKVKY